MFIKIIIVDWSSIGFIVLRILIRIYTMYNRNYYIVSPKVDGVTSQGFVETMLEQHIVMMGWGTDHKIGSAFNNLNKGDFVMVAQRVNWVFTYYFAGLIDDEQGFCNEDGILCRKLRNFIDLRGSKDDYLADVSFASMSAIKAMMSINPLNNTEVINRLDKIITMQENVDNINSFVSLLKANHNLILTGAPGTGKTYLAKEIAKAMGAKWKLVQFHPSYDYTDFVEGLRPVKNGDTLGFQRKDGVFKAFCKEALKYNVDSALEAFRSDLKKNAISIKSHKSDVTFDVELGDKNYKVFTNTQNCPTGGYNCSFDSVKKYIETGYYDEKHQTYQPSIGEYVKENYLKKIPPYVLIIDEINRGEISKIFGELFCSIDVGYRGEKGKVETQYQNLIPKEGDADFDLDNADVFRNGFYVPENVYIIGTMNDIDRSVESMDFAMRRRFAWKEITAESRQSMLDDEEAWNGNKPAQEVIDEIKVRMNNLNACIIDKYGNEEMSPKDKIGLTKAYQIGAAYFLKYGLYGNFDDLWNNHLEGLLYEYLRGTSNLEAKIERLHQAFNDTEAH